MPPYVRIIMYNIYLLLETKSSKTGWKMNAVNGVGVLVHKRPRLNVCMFVCGDWCDL